MCSTVEHPLKFMQLHYKNNDYMNETIDELLNRNKSRILDASILNKI